MLNGIIGYDQNPYNSYINGYGSWIGNDTDMDTQNSFKRVGQDDDDKKEKECQTCKNRKYQDGSNEDVSFKSAAHVSPQAAGAAVRAHEGEHVSNAFKDAAQNNGKVITASVSIHTSVCPECGRSYVSGGDTRTQIKYYNESNPYQQDLKTNDGIKLRGANVDQVA